MVVQSQPLDAYDDRRLVAAFQAGDADAFAQIVGAHHGLLTAEARRRLRSSGDAEDAVQETLLRAYLALDRFGGEYHLHAWLSRILANVCADTGARHSAELRMVDRLGPQRDEAPAADEEIGDFEQQRAVKEAVNSLPESYRMAFILREIEEFSYAQVAEKMGISEANARARVHRARRSLTKALRNTGAVLAGFPVTMHLTGLKRLFPRSAAKRIPGLASYSRNPKVLASGGEIPSSAVPVASQSSLPTLFQAPLSETSQAVVLAASSPLSQSIIAGASVAWHATLPVAAALATVAASAAMVGSGAAASNPTSPTPTLNAHNILAASTADLAAFVDKPAAPGPADPSADASATSASTTPSSTTKSTASTSTTGTTSTTTSSDPWAWVGTAASGGAGPAATAASSGTQAPTQAAGSSASAGIAPSAACPWTGTFPGAPNGPIPLPPAEPADAVASSYFSSDTFTLGTNAGPAFEVGGLGQFAQGSNTLTLQTLYGACLPTTSNPELVANLSNPANEALGALQLRGALVSSQTSGGTTFAYYRGTSVWLDGPNASADPLVFVAQVTLGQPSNISTLRVAFFGAAPIFAPPAACPTTSDTPTTPVAGDPGASTSTSSTSTSVATASGSDGSANSTSTSGTPPCIPAASSPPPTPVSPSTTPSTDPTSPTSGSGSPASPAPSSTDPPASTVGPPSTDASPSATTPAADPTTPSPMVMNSTGWNSPAVASPAAS